MNKIVQAFSIDKDIIDKLKAEAQRQRRAMSNLVNLILADWIGKHKFEDHEPEPEPESKPVVVRPTQKIIVKPSKMRR